MNKQEVMDKIQSIFRTVLKHDDLILTENLSANDVQGWDSLSHMLLISEIESALNIKFKLKDLNKMKQVGDLVDIVLSKLS
ncbi:acyl carrier protein [Bacteroidia bacterium]|nr:acyl carrier protein [Bacteroidia bacterium]